MFPGISATEFQRISMGVNVSQLKKAWCWGSIGFISSILVVCWFAYVMHAYNPNLGKDDINGIKLVNAIREHPTFNDIIVFALTGYATHGDEAHFLSNGFNKYISKPVDFEFVRHIIWEAIHNRRPLSSTNN
jgi:DNA-binding NarL/FixJ family response regulator